MSKKKSSQSAEAPKAAQSPAEPAAAPAPDQPVSEASAPVVSEKTSEKASATSEKPSGQTPEAAPENAPASAAAPTDIPKAPSEQPPAAALNPAPAKPAKKHTGLIIFIIILLLLLISGGCLAVWYFCIYSTPENIAFDAVRQFITAENVSTEGSVDVYFQASSRAKTKQKASVKFTSASNGLPNSTTATLELSERDKKDKVVDGHIIEIELGTAIMSNGVAYIKVGNLVETIDKALDEAGESIEDGGSMAEAAYAVAKMVDGEWWEISIEDIADELGMKKEAKPVISLKNCLFEVAAKDHSSEIFDLYSSHRFVKVAKSEAAALAPASGNSLYELELDYDELAEFINALPESSLADELFVCANDYIDSTYSPVYEIDRYYDDDDDLPANRTDCIGNSGSGNSAVDNCSPYRVPHISSDDFKEVKPSELKKVFPKDLKIYLEISDFSHQLRRVIYNTDDEDDDVDYEISLELSFAYARADVKAPEGFHSLTDILDDISDLFSGASDDDYDIYDIFDLDYLL